MKNVDSEIAKRLSRWKSVFDGRLDDVKKCVCSILSLCLGISCLVVCGCVSTATWRYIVIPFNWSTNNVCIVVLWEIVCVGILVSFLSIFLSKFIETISGKIERSNWHWQGGVSLFVWIIVIIIKALRTVSVLQLAKAFYRLVSVNTSIELSNNVYVESKRSDVSPLFQEIYLLIWGVFLFLQLLMGGSENLLLIALDGYFIVESMTWVLYYSVFRRFFEENYSVYHTMEHLPIILFIIPLQAVAYALTCMYGDGVGADLWKQTLPVLLGQASEHHIVFSIVGFVYSAIVVSIIVSTFPVERVKVGIPKIIVIGAGAVVRDRLMPALCKRLKYKVGDISIYTKESGCLVCTEQEGEAKVEYVAEKSDCEGEIVFKNIYELITLKAKNVIAWIETPSDTHLYYLRFLKDSAALVVVEKPMACNIRDLVEMKEIVSSSNRQKIFFLSYYLLEKALVLTFLMRPCSFYTKYFTCFELASNGQEKEEKEVAKFYKAYLELGKLKKIDIKIEETADNRLLPQGGQLIETFLHHCLIASLFVGIPSTWKNVKSKRNENGKEAKIRLNAQGEFGENISLYLRKKDGIRKRQVARMEFENGRMDADFDKREAIIEMKDRRIIEMKDRRICLAIKEKYQRRYVVLCDMVYECYFNRIDPTSVDGLYHQVEVLEWLLTSKCFNN